MTCQCVPLSTDTARLAITNRLAQLQQAHDALPDSAVRAWLHDVIRYTERALQALDTYPAGALRLAVGSRAQPVIATSGVRASADDFAAVDLHLMLGGHQVQPCRAREVIQ